MSDTSSDEKPTSMHRRYNNMFLDVKYNPSKVHQTTRARWKKRLMKFRQAKIGSQETATENDVAPEEQLIPSTSQSSIDPHFIISSPTPEIDPSQNNPSPRECLSPLENPETIAFSSSTLDQHDEESSFYSSSSDVSNHNDSQSSDKYEEQEETDMFPNNPISFETMSHVMMFSEANLSTRDVSLMLMGYSIRFHLTYEARGALFNMCKMFAGARFENWNTSKFVLNRLYDPPDEVIRLCFICKECFESLLPPVSKRKFKNVHVKCSCGLEYDLTTSSSDYVITVHLKYQMKILLENKDIKNMLLRRITDIKSNKNKSGDMKDVYDSQLYKQMQEKYSEASHLVSLHYSTDGAPVCNSEVKSFWPIQVIINELPPNLRFKYPLLAGLSINTKEPSPEFMNAYMKHFVNQCTDLTRNGLEITDENDTPITLKIVPLCCPVDSVARPILQNRLQYSGYYGCSYCYEHGLHDHNAMRYPLQEEDAALRTDESHRKDYDNRKSTQQQTVRGVKGWSVLLTLLSFNMVWGFPIDYLHAELLGVVKYLWNIWVESKIITASKIRELNERLLNMTPPHEIHRLPRTLKVKAKWKASEWRSWLLFYSLVCLEDLISTEALEHYALLVDSVSTLLQHSISEQELRICEEKLLVFVAQCQDMYDTRVMTFNIHSLLHLVQSVRTAGPLWATSTFPFESAIFYLKCAMTGPKGLYDQIAKRTLQRLTFQFTVQRLATSDACVRFCKNLFAHRNCKDILMTSEETMLLGPLGVTDDGTQLFNRCIHNSSVFHSTKYSRPTKTNDTVVELVSKEIGQIEVFRYKNGETFITLTLFMVVPKSQPLTAVHHIEKVVPKNEVVTVPIQSIFRKLVYMKATNSTYVARLPNTFEIQ